MLADLVLQHPAAWRALGDWETRLLRGRLAAVPIERPVFIAGLARAGTTILLRKLSELPQFGSHRYADFPFLFTPYAWSRLRRRRVEVPRERMHKDRIEITTESPEAMEEVLWMAFFDHLHDPGRSNVLGREPENPEFARFFSEHMQKLLLARGGTRYLSKNNYNVTRLGYLARLFPDARFLVPIREPLSHVASLMKQHALFSQVQRESDAARRHLRLVGHFEFGLDRRPINPDDSAGVASVEALWRDGQEARGWARYWALIHRQVLGQIAGDEDLRGRLMLVPYEAMCDRSAAMAAAVGAHVGIPDAAAAGLAQGFSRPDYYEPRFTPEERAAITEETACVERRIVEMAPQLS